MPSNTLPPEQFQQLLLGWFAEHGRKNLPWQQNINAYRVWLSETMLQQTQVNTVIPYYNRFTERFPTLQTLAQAEIDEVLHYWSGLGYYARARNLHKTAQQLSAYNYQFPETLAELTALPGIGRSTAGAILSIAMQQSHPILDGNVKRVLSRFHAISGWPGESRVAATLWDISRQYTPSPNAAAYTQAIMDLGATLCTRSKPLCPACPIAKGCVALANNLVSALPTVKPKKQLISKQCYFLLLENQQQQFYLEKRPSQGVWGGLWSLPEFAELTQLQQWCAQQNLHIDSYLPFPSARHTFSHFHLDYTAIFARIKNPVNFVMEANAGVWYKSAELNALGLPTPIKRILQQQISEMNYDKND
jgi:A/G-specific adenine glycosylase